MFVIVLNSCLPQVGVDGQIGSGNDPIVFFFEVSLLDFHNFCTWRFSGMVTWDHRLSFLFEDFCSQKNWLEGAQSAPETVLLSFLKTC